MSENTIKLIFQPETPIPVGYIPAINMDHPTKKNERLLPDVIVEEDEKGETRFLFEVDSASARVILERDPCFKLWAPAELKVVMRGRHGAELVTLRSVDPTAAKPEKPGKKGPTPIVVPPSDEAAQKLLEASKG